MSIEMAFRDQEGGSIVAELAGVDSNFVRPARRLAVLIHGLAETEAIWRNALVGDGADSGLAASLTADGFTPLLLRYNTGCSISENGRELAALLDRVTAAWPVPVDEVALVGNSMGGLVARSALQEGRNRRFGWTTAVQRLVTVGSPHLGSPLEKLAAGASRALRFAPETRPISQFLESRSEGIKDLHSGAINDDEAHADRFTEHFVSLQPSGVEHHFIAGVVTANSEHPVGKMVGDLIVRAASATGRGRVRSVEAKESVVLGGRRHFDLAGDPDVIAQIREWLSPLPTVDGF
jgi:pimeloyl-ACP methyl ester carboxylesterase